MQGFYACFSCVPSGATLLTLRKVSTLGSGAFMLKAVVHSNLLACPLYLSTFKKLKGYKCCAEPGGSGVGLRADDAFGHASAEPQPAQVGQAATAAQANLASPGEDVAQPTAHRALQGTQQASAALDMAQSGCAERFAAPAQHHVDPFGILEYKDMWPANSTARVKPRPFPVGPAYNSSHFDVFINTSFVMLVRSPLLCLPWVTAKPACGAQAS